MPWPVVRKGADRPFLIAAVVGLALLFACGSMHSVHAVDTEVGAKVCGPDDGASIEISQPNDDSIVTQPVVTLRGTVWNSSQLIIEIDGAYNNTVAIAANQTTFTSDVSLQQGTHTLTVTANEICGGTDGVDSIVVTYEPVPEPSSGSETPTVVEGSVTVGGEPAPVPAGAELPARTVRQIPVIGTVTGIVSDFATAVGLQATIANNGTTTVGGVARVGLTVAALTSVVLAGTIAPLAAQSLPGITEVFDSASHRSMLYLGWLIRGVGVLTMALAYFI